jgi:hypothetical protein
MMKSGLQLVTYKLFCFFLLAMAREPRGSRSSSPIMDGFKGMRRDIGDNPKERKKEAN